MPSTSSSSSQRRTRAARLPFRLSICGKNELDGFADQGVTHILSLEDPSVPKCTPSWFRGVHWQLQFHDVDSVQQAQVLCGTAVTERQVQSILDCGQECLRASRMGSVHLLVHCQAGISRSTAAAYAIVASLLGPGREIESLRLVCRLRPEAFPNLLLVQHADRLLGRQGQLVRALASVRPCVAERPATWLVRPQDSWDPGADLDELDL